MFDLNKRLINFLSGKLSCSNYWTIVRLLQGQALFYWFSLIFNQGYWSLILFRVLS